jgi:hypothetical protein
MKLKRWYEVHPTLIGSDFNRYEIDSREENGKILNVYVKNPCIGMEGCDRCSGPHRPKNRFCSQNLNREPFLPSPNPNVGGIFLFDLESGVRIQGLWYVEKWIQPATRRTAMAVLRKAS